MLTAELQKWTTTSGKASFVPVMLGVVIVLTLASSALGADKTRVYECDKFGNLIARWDPPGAPAVGDRIRVKNLTIDKMTNIKYNGALKIATLPLGATSGFIAMYAVGDNITGCARCNGGRSHADCFDDIDLTLDPASLVLDPGCVDCQVDVPTVSEWGLMVMTLLLLTAGTVIFGRGRRKAQAA